MSKSSGEAVVRTIATCGTSAIVGGIIVFIGQSAELRLKPLTMTFEQWTGILLASVAVLITALGVVIAIAAIWGFSAIKRGAESASTEHVRDSLANGDLGQKIDERFTAYLNERLDKGQFRELIERRVDEVVYRGSEVRAGLVEDDPDAHDDDWLFHQDADQLDPFYGEDTDETSELDTTDISSEGDQK